MPTPTIQVPGVPYRGLRPSGLVGTGDYGLFPGEASSVPLSDQQPFPDTTMPPPDPLIPSGLASRSVSGKPDWASMLIPIITGIVGAARGNGLLGAAAGVQFGLGAEMSKAERGKEASTERLRKSQEDQRRGEIKKDIIAMAERGNPEAAKAAAHSGGIFDLDDAIDTVVSAYQKKADEQARIQGIKDEDIAKREQTKAENSFKADMMKTASTAGGDPRKVEFGRNKQNELIVTSWPTLPLTEAQIAFRQAQADKLKAGTLPKEMDNNHLEAEIREAFKTWVALESSVLEKDPELIAEAKNRWLELKAEKDSRKGIVKPKAEVGSLVPAGTGGVAGPPSPPTTSGTWANADTSATPTQPALTPTPTPPPTSPPLAPSVSATPAPTPTSTPAKPFNERKVRADIAATPDFSVDRVNQAVANLMSKNPALSREDAVKWLADKVGVHY